MVYWPDSFVHINRLQLEGKRIFLRADLNVALQQGSIYDDYRLCALEPTLRFLAEHKTRIVLATHIGRPGQPTPALSTKHLIPWFTTRGYRITWQPDLEQAYTSSLSAEPGTIILLENLRFFPGEKQHDPHLADQLARLGDYYINDAFALAHRTDTSITLVPGRFAPDKRAIGFLIVKELRKLNPLIVNPSRPFLAILGGGKVHDKLPLLEHLINFVDGIMVCPAIVFTFLRAQGYPTGLSLVDENALSDCLNLLDKAAKSKVYLFFPLDYQVAQGSINGPLSFTDTALLSSDSIGVSVGPKTIQSWSPIIAQAKTLFFNSGMGFPDRPETTCGAQALLTAVAQSTAYSVVGGGESVAIARSAGVEEKLSFLSTGGGATLTYLSGKPLPGLEVLRIF